MFLGLKRDFCGLTFTIGNKDHMVQRVTWEEPERYNKTVGRVWFGHKTTKDQVDGRCLTIKSGAQTKTLKNIKILGEDDEIKPFEPTNIEIEEVITKPLISKFKEENT